MIEQTLDIATKDGAMETFICHPERGGPYPAVLLLMDAPGIREELRDMARRLGTVGYYVLLPNLYYRAGRDTIYGPDVLTHGSAEHGRMRAVRTKMTIPPVMDDVAVFPEEDEAGDHPEHLHGQITAVVKREENLVQGKRRALSRRDQIHDPQSAREEKLIVTNHNR